MFKSEHFSTDHFLPNEYDYQIASDILQSNHFRPKAQGFDLHLFVLEHNQPYI